MATLELNKFKEYLQSDGLNQKTIYQYCKQLEPFFIFLNDKEISEQLIREYVLKRNNCKPETINQDLKAISNYLKFIGKKEIIKLPKWHKRKKKIPRYFTEEFFKKEIISVADMLDNPMKKKAILYFIFYTGIRKSELPLIKRNDINMKNKTVKITDKKNSHERIVPFPKKIIPYLKEYFEIEPEEKNAFNSGISTIDYICFELNQNIDEIHLHPHIFRDSFATNYRNKGIRIETLQYLLGHSSIITTMKYAHANIDGIQSEVNKLIK